MENTMKFEHKTFGKKLKTMLAVDFRRMFKSPIFYIMIGVALVIPALILVMTTMMDGTVSVDPTTGAETVMEGFDNVWQSIGSVSGESSEMSMDLTSMCNINMMYFLAAVLICIFIADDFRSGYAKNLFTVRANKADYVISKTLIGFVGGAAMLIAYFVGTMLGGAISGLPFALGALTVGNIVMCMLAKVFLMLVFVAIFVLVSVATKQKLWASIIGSLGASMLLFTMIPMMTPLNSSIMNVMMCLIGGVLFSIGLGAVSKMILSKTSLV
ncbi:MAG: ABC transporter permease [Clostridia bacterium]|nr:ABC transporter permease [Clostridia bacterium]